MRRTLAAAIALVSVMAQATPAWAHGDHDARPLARHVQAGPYTLSLWQVYPDVGAEMRPRLIVMLDEGAIPSEVSVNVYVNSVLSDIAPSATTRNGWETTGGIGEGDEIEVSISDGLQTWELEPVIVPPAPTAMLPMRELIAISVFFAAGVAWWVAGRTTRTWRRLEPEPS